MSNEQRIETLRQLIVVSTVLTESEKTEWLSLLELMNDKQLGELEEILAADKPAAPPVSSPPTPPPATTPTPPPVPPVSVGRMPQLSHISNLPSSVSIPTPMPSPERVAPKPMPTAPPPLSREVTKPPAAPTPQPKRDPIATANFKDLSELIKLTPEDLRNYGDSILPAITQLVGKFGYFATSQSLETSPLFHSYLTTGKSRLQGTQPPAESALSQAEFELVTDILLAMRQS